MASCLGIYVDKNLIKYAKVKRKNNRFKIESFNVDVFEDLDEAIGKAVSETNSYRIPICINISNEIYNYFETFAELEKKDITKSLEIEFEKWCNKNGVDSETFESRYILNESMVSEDKYNAIYVSTNKKELEDQLEIISKHKVISMAPLAISITNLLEVKEHENIAIINLENDTKITTIIDGQIESIKILDSNLSNAIKKIDQIEMSWKKSYDVLKNITVYSSEVKSLDINENEYIDVVMPELNKISKEVLKYLKKYNKELNKVFISGMGATINNIDLYFQDVLGLKCEVLKPFFINSTSLKFPVKEYIEVNSAIALALDGLEYINKDLNFVKQSTIDNIENVINSAEDFNIHNLKEYLKMPYDIYDRLIVRSIAAILIAIIGFICFSIASSRIIKKQTYKTNQKLADTVTEIDNIDNNIKIIKNYNNIYNSIINNKSFDKNRSIPKDSIPNLLNKIMFVIPGEVQLLSIKNTDNTHIVIETTSNKKENIETFYKAIQDDGILKNMKMIDKNYDEEKVFVTIEGDI